MNQQLWKAISQRRLIRLRYQGKERILEPHDYGVHNGVEKLLAYQIGGESSQRLPNWRWIRVDQISDIVLLDRRFNGGRRAPSGEHHVWDELYVRVAPPGNKRAE